MGALAEFLKTKKPIRATRVKIAPDAVPHGRRIHPPTGNSVLERMRGEWVQLVLPAVRREDHPLQRDLWSCDSEWLWELPPAEVERITGKRSDMRIFVCEHQIVLD